jgi:hypothetical protein
LDTNKQIDPAAFTMDDVEARASTLPTAPVQHDFSMDDVEKTAANLDKGIVGPEPKKVTAPVPQAQPKVIPVKEKPNTINYPVAIEGGVPTNQPISAPHFVDEQGNEYANNPNEDAINQTRSYLNKQGQDVTVQAQRNFFNEGHYESALDPNLTKEKALRVDLSLSHTGSDAQLKFKQYFPEGDMQEVYHPLQDSKGKYKIDQDGNYIPDVSKPVMVFRRNENEPYARASLDASEKMALLAKQYATNRQAIDAGDPIAKKEAQKLVNDVIVQLVYDNGDKLPEFLATTLAGGASVKAAEGASWVVQALAAAGGFGAAEFAEKYGISLTEQARGVTDRDKYEIATDAAKAAGWTSLTAMFMTGVMRVGNWLRGDPGRIPDTVQKAIDIGKEYNLPSLMPQQVFEKPLLRRMATNARELLPAIKKREQEQEEAAYALIKSLNPDGGDAYKTIHTQLATEFERKEAEVLQNLESSLSLPISGATRLERGTALAKVEPILQDMELRVANMYKNAHDLGDAKYDLTSVKKSLDAYAEGIPSLGQAGSEDIGRVIGQQGPLPIRDIGPQWAPEVKSVVDEITNAFATLPTMQNAAGKEFSSIDQINAWMRRLGPLTEGNINQGSVGPAQQQAKYVYGVLANLRNNPITDSAGQAAAFAQARARFQELAELKEAYPIIAAKRANDPSYAAELDQLGRTLTSPTAMKFNTVNLYKRILPDADFKVLQSGVTRDLASTPYGITEKMAQWDQNPELRDLLMPKGDQAAFRQAGKAFDELAQSHISNVLKSQDEEATKMLVQQLISTNETQRYKVLASITKDPSSPLGQQVRAGIIDNILGESIKMYRGEPRLLQAAIEQNLNNAETKRLTQFLLPRDIKVMKDVAYWLEFSQANQKDMGAALQAAGVGADVVKFKPEALLSLMAHGLTGKALVNAKVSNWLGRTGVPALGIGAPVQIANLARIVLSDDKKSSAEVERVRYKQEQEKLKAAAELKQTAQQYADGGIVKAPTSPDAVEQALQKLRDQKDSLQKTINSINNPPQPPVKKADGGLIDSYPDAEGGMSVDQLQQSNPGLEAAGQKYVDWQKNRDFEAELSDPNFWTNYAASIATPVKGELPSWVSQERGRIDRMKQALTELDSKGAEDSEYRYLMSTGSKTKERQYKTWRDKYVGSIAHLEERLKKDGYADGGLVNGDTEVRRALRNRERDRSLVGKIGPGVPEQYDVDYRRAGEDKTADKGVRLDLPQVGTYSEKVRDDDYRSLLKRRNDPQGPDLDKTSSFKYGGFVRRK